MWWLDRFVYLWLLPVLLLCTLGYVGFHANLFLFRVHGLHLLWILSDARNCRLPRRPVLCSPHLPVDQMRVADLVLFFWLGREEENTLVHFHPSVLVKRLLCWLVVRYSLLNVNFSILGIFSNSKALSDFWSLLNDNFVPLFQFSGWKDFELC